MYLSSWAIRNPIPVVLMVIALTLAGIASYRSLVVKQFPNIDFPSVQVTVTQNGAAASEVETQITRPIEDALTGIAGLRHVSSTVTLGSSVTTAEFELGSEMQKATDDVRTAVETTRANLPQGIDAPSTSRVDQSSAPILTYAVSAPGMSDVDLSWLVDDTIARSVQAVGGVAQVTRVGGVDREINVTLDADRLSAWSLTAADINTALANLNRDDTGGRADIGTREQTIRVLGSATTVAALNDVTIPVSNRYVRLGDVATISDGRSEKRGFARLDGRPAVAFQVSKTTNSSDVSVERAIDEAVQQLDSRRTDIEIRKIVSTVKETRESYSATVHVLIEGMVLAALAVFLFLRNWRATLIAAVAMPLSLVPTFAAMLAFGFSLNIITLLGLTLVIGILVDDAIVEIENIEKRIERGESPYRASLIGADAIGLAVIATTMAIVVVFTPVSFMSGQAGQFFKEFGVTVSVAVLFSLLIARFVTPLMAAYFLRPLKHEVPHRPLPRFYASALDGALKHPWLTILLGTVALFASLALASTMPTGFQPTSDPGYFYLEVEGPQGATTADMDEAVRHATHKLLARADVETVFAQVGSISSGGMGGSGGSSGVSSGTLTVVLKDDRSKTTDAFQRSITAMLRTIPDVRITNQGGFGSAGVEIVLAGSDPETLQQAQSKLLGQMRTVKEVLEPRPSPPPSAPQLVIRPISEAASRLNVSSQAIAQAVRVATIGDIDANTAKFSEGERQIPIRVRLPRTAREDLTSIASLRIPTLDGKTTTLSSIADISFEAGPGEIIRYDREQRLSVKGDLNDVTLGEAREEIMKLPIMQNLPSGVREAPTGDTEAMNELFGNIIGAMASGVFLIYFVLVLLFRSFFKPVTILSALPLTIIGAFVALKLAGLAITMPVLIGLLMLLGLAAKNSILLVEFAIEDERAGQAQRDAIVNACKERARPIVMTTIAMGAGMLPTAIGIGEGATFRQPMAVAVIGGLLSSTVLSLVLVPAVYELIDRFEMRIRPKLARFVTPKQPGDDDPVTFVERAPARA
ncbi:efflux RND transporter permease subunit [Sphingomonas radiodurans]|uniref:efflux RND transporter permease subunit n=1 Tax=Sphingomonas radiodurans TaxID=2890321 RepID=UPI001E614C63|nr:efflux RND transporter permease subunit [Sphingomonas radiodurans]WBH15829.1 efflux RND transporter permease subunit [Sphingomonas radiodurans]